MNLDNIDSNKAKILDKIEGQYIGSTWLRLGSLYLTIEKIKSGTYKNMYKLLMYETRFNIRYTKIYNVILSSNDLLDYVNNNIIYQSMFAPTSDNNTYLDIKNMSFKFNKYNELKMFNITFSENYHYLSITLSGYNITKII